MSCSSPRSARGGVLSRSQRSQNTNGKSAGNHDEEFLEDRPPNQGRHILTLLTACAPGADSLLTSVIPSPPRFYPRPLKEVLSAMACSRQLSPVSRNSSCNTPKGKRSRQECRLLCGRSSER